MAGSFYGEFLDTEGVEIEGSIERNILSNRVLAPLQRILGKDSGNTVMLGKDASTEYYVFRAATRKRTMTVSYHTKAGRSLYENFRNSDLRVAGYELITVPLQISDLENVVFHATRLLKEAGDFCSDRTAVHFHVGFVNNLRLLKNFLRIALTVDPVLYRIGGMGRHNRGHINRFAYCRPLLHSTAVNVVNDMTLDLSGKHLYAKIANPLAALEADTIAQFWASFGVDYRPGGGASKYWATRYSGINLYAVPQHGTVEFRHFNKTLNPLEIMSVGKFVRCITELSSVIGKNDIASFEVVPSDVEISDSDGTDILYRLYGMCQSYEVSNLPSEIEMNCLVTLLTTSHMDTIPTKPVLTHLKENHTIPLSLVKAGKLEMVPEVFPPQYVDIHNIGLLSLFNDGQVPETLGEDEDEPGFPEDEDEMLFDGESEEEDTDPDFDED